PCIFIKENENKEKTIIAIYVDDCFIIGNQREIEKVKIIFNQEFKMKDNKELQGFLGIQVIRNEKELTLDQEVYIENLLKKTGMSDCKPVSTPMIIDNSKEKDKKLTDVTNYQSITGSLIYLSTATRPDY